MSPAVPGLDRLRRSFSGDVIEPGHADYDGARHVWNAMFDRRPAVVLRPAGVPDVVAAVRFAREAGLPLAVRCGGHSPNGHSTLDGGVVIDLARLGSVTVDPASRTASVGGGALLKSLDAAAQAHGLVCPVGVVGHTGVGGLTLGGGMGRLQRHFGLTIDNLAAVELVTASGEVVRASDDEHPELFWAIRGAGHNFGVVTSFEFRLHPFAGTLNRAVRLYPAERIHDVWSTVQAYAATAPDAVSLVMAIGRAEPASDYPDSIGGRPIVVVGVNHSGDAAAFERDTAGLAAGPEPAVLTAGPTKYLEIQLANDEAMGWGRRSYISGGMTNGLSPERLDALVAHVERAPTPDTGFGLGLQGGAIGRVPDEATAYAGRAARWEMSADAGTWDDPALDPACLAWVNEAMAIAAPDAAPGRYVNEIGESGPAITRSIYGDGIYDRLAEVKRAWDPANVFRANHNVEPAAPA